MPLRCNQSVGDMIAELMRSYARDGKIGNTRPRNKAHAMKIARAIAMQKKRECESE